MTDTTAPKKPAAKKAAAPKATPAPPNRPVLPPLV